MISNADLCGDCMHYTGEECDGPGGSREGCEVYSDTPACDCYEENEGRSTMDRASPAELRKAMEVAQLLVKSGVDFVPMPVLNQADKEALVADAARRIDAINNVSSREG